MKIRQGGEKVLRSLSLLMNMTWNVGKGSAKIFIFLMLLTIFLLNSTRNEMYKYILIILILCGFFLIVKYLDQSSKGKKSYQSISKKTYRQESQTEYADPLEGFFGRKNIVIEAKVEGFTARDKSNRPDKLYLDWGGRRTVLNIWNKQPQFNIEIGKKYIFHNISCSKNKYDGKPSLNYDVNYYGSLYLLLEEHKEEKKQYSNFERQGEKGSSLYLDELLKEFGPFDHRPTLEELNQRKKYWNQVLHPDYNMDKPEKLRKKMEEELKRKNQIYDELVKMIKI